MKMDREQYRRLSAEKKKQAKIAKSLENRLLRNLNKQGIVGNIKINCEKGMQSSPAYERKKGMQK